MAGVVVVVSAGVAVVSAWSDWSEVVGVVVGVLAVSLFTVSVCVVSAGLAMTFMDDSLAKTLLTETKTIAAMAANMNFLIILYF